MVKTLYFILPIFILNSFEQPRAEIIEKRAASFSIVSPQILHIRDSTEVTVKVDSTVNTNSVFQWTTNLGEIKGNGNKVMYYAPHNTGLATIKLLLRDDDDTLSDSSNILIYKQIILLKADDLSCNKKQLVSSNWRRFLTYVETKNIKASLGLIGISLEQGNWHYIKFLRRLSSSGSFEIWNHGYNHLLNGKNKNGETYHEFWNTPFEYQKQHLLKTQKLAKDMLHITLFTFGAPGNAIDDNTRLALEDIDEIKIWYFGFNGSSKMVIDRIAEIEFPTHFPDVNNFIENYDSTATALALQIHPNSWDERRFSEFEKIIDYLIARAVTFINPHEYYSLMKIQ